MAVTPWSWSMLQFCARQVIMIETHLGRRVGALGLSAGTYCLRTVVRGDVKRAPSNKKGLRTIKIRPKPK